MRITISPLDLFRVNKNMQSRAQRLKSAVDTIFQKSLFVVERYTKIESPVDTGRMRASISEGKELYPTFASIGPTVEYAKYVNAKNPFMERGARQSVPDIKKVIKDSVREALKK